MLRASSTALPASFLAGLILAATAGAQVPPAEQVQTFTRIFAFDRALAGTTVAVVLVGEGDTAALEPLRQEFQRAGMTARVTTPAGLAGQMEGASVVYFAADAVTDAARAVVAERGALSIAGAAELAEAGRVSVALDPTTSRVGIVVNSARLEAEGHSLSPQLLKQPWVKVSRTAGPAASGALPACTVTRFAAPAYPTVARRMSVEGTVQLRVVVGSDLRAEQVDVVESVRFLDDAAVAAASDSQYARAGACSLAIPFQLEADG